MHPEIAAEIVRCRDDFMYFCKTYLKIRDKKDNIIPLIPNPAQMLVFEAVKNNKRVYVLKSRQMGITTFIWAIRFWKWKFKPGYEGLTTAHREKDAEKIFRICKRFQAHLPEFLKKNGMETVRENLLLMESGIGNIIACQTVGTGLAEEQDRGGTLSDLHCTEFAFYRNIGGTMAGLFQQVGKNPIVLETTANSLNDAHAMWEDDNGYLKLFLPWTLDPGYVMDEPPELFKPTWRHCPEWSKYAYDWKLTETQLNWALHTFIGECNSSWNLFNQEYPITAELAFITSGQRFFNRVYPHVKGYDGYEEYVAPQHGRRYAAGIDAAGGAPDGDKQACSILDVTDDVPFDVASLYVSAPPKVFAQYVLWMLQRYSALAVPERNSWGESIIEHLVEHSYPHIYREFRKDRISSKPVDVFGRTTSESSRYSMFASWQEIVNGGDAQGGYQTVDARHQSEINTFVYGEDGKPSAAGKRRGSSKAQMGISGRCYDDMITSKSLAWVGREQALQIHVSAAQKRPPQTLREKLQWEMTTGMIYNRNAASVFGRKVHQGGENPSQRLHQARGRR